MSLQASGDVSLHSPTICIGKYNRVRSKWEHPDYVVQVIRDIVTYITIWDDIRLDWVLLHNEDKRTLCGIMADKDPPWTSIHCCFWVRDAAVVALHLRNPAEGLRLRNDLGLLGELARASYSCSIDSSKLDQALCSLATWSELSYLRRLPHGQKGVASFLGRP